MKSLNIKYRINVRIYIRNLNIYKSFTKDFSKVIQKEDNLLYDNAHTISKSYILDYFHTEIMEFLNDKNIGPSYDENSNIVVDEFEVTSLTKNVDVYFDNEEDPGKFTLYPMLIAFVQKEIDRLQAPDFHGELLGKTSIRWYWEGNEKHFYFIVDEYSNVIKQLPPGSSEYIETGLEYDTAYTRQIVPKNSFALGGYSNPVTVKTAKGPSSKGLVNYTEERKNIDVIKDVITPQERLDAFTVGTGYGEDCKVSKIENLDVNESGNAEFIAFGIGTEERKFYPKTGFDFRYLLNAKYNTSVREGSISIRTKAYKVQEGKVRLYRYALKPITISYKVSATIAYFRRNGSSFTPVKKTLTYTASKTLAADLNQVEFKNGYASMKTRYEKLDNRSVGDIIMAKAREDSDIVAALNDSDLSSLVRIYDYRLSDNYKNDLDESFNQSAGDSSVDGEIRVTTADSQRQPLQASHHLFLKGRPSAQLYTRDIIKSARLEGENNQVFTDADYKLPLICTVNSGLTYDPSSGGVVNKVLSVGGGIAVDGNGNIVSSPAIDSGIVRKEMTEDNPSIFFVYSEMMPQLDSLSKYRFVTTVEAINGEVLRSNGEKVTVGYKIDEVVQPESIIAFEAKARTVVNDYQEYFPPLEERPLFGNVNGVEASLKKNGGKRDAVYKSYEFPLDHSFYDLQVSVEISNIEPESHSIRYQFLTTNSTVSSTPGDVVTFSCENSITSSVDIEEKLQSKSVYVEFDSFGDKEVKCDLNLSQSDTSRFDFIDVYMYSTNPAIVPIKESIRFNSSDNITVSEIFTCINTPAHPWRLGVHNGYYYLNQHEHFLYSDDKPYTEGRVKEEIREEIREEVTTLISSKEIKLGKASFGIKVTMKGGRVFSKDFYYDVLMDTKEYTVAPRFEDLVLQICNENKVNMKDVVDTSVTPYDPAFRIQWTETTKVDENVDLDYIFKNWGRAYGEGGTSSDWAWDNDAKLIRSTGNYNHYTSIISDKPYDNFNATVRFASPNSWGGGGDDDVMGFVIAHVVKNGVPHALVAYRSFNFYPVLDPNYHGGDTFNCQWAIFYTKGTLASRKIMANGTNKLKKLSVIDSKIEWYQEYPNGTVIEVDREVNRVTARCSEFGSNDVQAYTEITLNFDDFPELSVFKEAGKYGFCCISQDQSTFDRISFDTPVNITGPIIANSYEENYTYHTTTSVEENIYEKVTESLTDKVIMKGDTIELSPLPQQYCPIIIKNKDTGKVYEQIFNKNGSSSSDLLTESKSYNYDTNKVFLAYSNIDKSTVSIFAGKKQMNVKEIKGSCVELTSKVNAGEIITVSYRPTNVFKADYNVEEDKVTLKHFDKVFNNAIITYESNKKSNLKEVDHISINPVSSSRYSGFLFIDYKDNKPCYMKIHLTTDIVHLHIGDNTRFYIEVLDKDFNPVEKCNVSISECTNATYSIDSNITDINGIVAGTLRNFKGVGDIVLKASVGSLSDTVKLKVNDRRE